MATRHEYRINVAVATDAAAAYFRRAEVSYAVGNVSDARKYLELAARFTDEALEEFEKLQAQPNPMEE